MANRFAFSITVAVLFLALITQAQQNTSASLDGATQPSAGHAGTPSTDCYMPAPDPVPAEDRSDAPSGDVKIAKPAKDAAAEITVNVSKPLPQCASDLSSLNPDDPSLSTTARGYAPAKYDHGQPPKLIRNDWVGSPECLLLGLSSGSFEGCNEPAKKQARLRKEKPSPDYAIINLVHWSLTGGKPARTSAWYLYDRHSLKASEWKTSDQLRIKGSDEVAFLAVHLGIDDSCSIQYSVEAKGKTPANTADLQLLLQAAASIPGVGGFLPSGVGGGATSGQAAENGEVPSPSTKAMTDRAMLFHTPPSLKSQLATDLLSKNPIEARKVLSEHHLKSATEESIRNLTIMVQKNPDSGVTNRLAVHALNTNPSLAKRLGIAIPGGYEPGIGVYGYASFKGLEKLPYDLTLTGKPGRTPKAAKLDGPEKYHGIAKTQATIINSVQKSEARLVKRPIEAVAITWGDEVPVTCGEEKGEPPNSAANVHDPGTPAKKQGNTVPELYRPALFLSTASAPAQNQDPAKPEPKNPASADDGASADQTKKSEDGGEFTAQQTYSNEGLYRWDVSIGVTAFTAKKNTFSASDGTVSKSTSRPENVYVFGDLFFPWKADLVEPPAFRWKPSISFGIPAGSQPFNRSVAGLSFGFKIAGFHFSPFVGSLFLREYRPKTLAIGDTTTASKLKADLTPKWTFRPFVSVNFSVRDAVNLIKNKGTSQSK